MAITTLDGMIAGQKQRIQIAKTNTTGSSAGFPTTMFDRSGPPGTGVLNPSSTTSGTVPTDATTGFPAIRDFVGSNTGYISRVETTRAGTPGNFGTVELFDLLFYAGATTIPTAGTTTVTLSGIPSFATRLPFKSDGATRDYDQVQLWMWFSTAGSNHAHSMSIDYLDQGGNAGNTGNVSTQNYGAGRMLRFPLASGDTGVQQITGYKVNGATSSTGAVVALAMRSLGTYHVEANSISVVHGVDTTGLTQVFSDSAIFGVSWSSGGNSLTASLNIEIVEG